MAQAALDTHARIAAIADEVEGRARACDVDGGQALAAVMRALAKDLRAGGPTAALAADFHGEPREALLSLRMACALHRAALDGRAEGLARYFPSTGGRFDPGADAAGLEAAVLANVVAEAALIRDYMQGPPQTNDVGRAAGLLGGFLEFAHMTGMPLDILEIGCSAGLNLCFDKFHYEIGAQSWGDPASAVRLRPLWEGPAPRLDAGLRIRRRMGADLSPVDVSVADARMRLASYVWPDQAERVNRLLQAIAIANTIPREIDRESADSWLVENLATAEPGVGRMVFHSAMWIYLPKPVQDAVERAIREAGARATAQSPLGWLSLEPGGSKAPQGCDVTLTTWPGGVTRVLGSAHTHGNWARWNG